MKNPLRLGKFEKTCAKNFVEWFKGRPKDVGGQCSKGIYKIILGERVEEDDQALGNGGLMRAMPCALLNNHIFNMAQCKLTHNNSECLMYLKIYSKLLNDYIHSNYIGIATNSLLEPSGHVKNTLNNSVYWSQKDSFKKAIIGAVNHGGDADTIAAITGSIAGAKFGYNCIPKRWIKQLNPEVKEFLEKFKNFVFSYLQI